MPKRKNSSISSNGAYERFIRGLKLIALGLENSAARLERDAYTFARRDRKEPVRRIQADYRVSDIGKGFFDCLASFNLIFEHPESKDLLLRVDSVFRCHFHTDSKNSEEMARRFVTAEFKLIIWPYFRQFVTDTTTRMGIAPVTVPFSTQADS